MGVRHQLGFKQGRHFSCRYQYSKIKRCNDLMGMISGTCLAKNFNSPKSAGVPQHYLFLTCVNANLKMEVNVCPPKYMYHPNNACIFKERRWELGLS